MSRAHESDLRLALYYQQRLHALEQRFQGNDETVHADLLADQAQINSFRNRCANRASEDDNAALLCSKFAGIAGTLFEWALPRPLVITWLEDGLAAADRLLRTAPLSDELRQEIVHDLGTHLTHLGFAHLLNGNLPRGRALCERALEVSREYGDRRIELAAQTHLAMIAMNEGQTDEAGQLLESSLAICQETGQDRNEATILETLGTLCANTGRHADALRHFERAITLFEELGEGPGLCTALANRGSLLLQLDRREQARHDIVRAKELAEDLRADGLRGLALANLAKLEGHDEERRNAALEMLEQARRCFARAGHRIQERRVLDGLEGMYGSALERWDELSYEQRSLALRRSAEIHQAKEEHDAAGLCYQRLLGIAEEADDLPDQLEALIMLGHLSVRQEHHAEATGFHQRALTVLARQRAQEGATINEKAECELHLSLGQALRHLSRPAEALEQYDQARRVGDRCGFGDVVLRARGNRALVQADLGAFDQATAELEELAEGYREKNEFRLFAHTRFNLAYAYHRHGDHTAARKTGEEACQLLDQIGDPSVAEVRQQMATWPADGYSPGSGRTTLPGYEARLAGHERAF